MRRLALGLLALGGVGFLGCTALLGSFEVATTSGNDGGPDAGTDASIQEAGDAADAAADYLVTCVAAPRAPKKLDEVVTDGGNEGGIDRPLGFFKTGQMVRVVYRKQGAPGFFVLTFNPNDGGPVPAPLHNPNAGQILDVRRVGASATGVLTFDYDQTNRSGSLVVYVIPDDNNTSVGSRVTISTPITFDYGPGVRLSGALESFGADDFFVAFAYPNPTAGGELQIGVVRRRATEPPLFPTVIATGLSGNKAAIGDSARAAGKVFLFDESEPGGKNTSYYPVPDAPVVGGGGVAPVPIAPPSKVTTLEVSAFSTPTTIALAVAEIDGTGGSPTPIVLRAGDVPQAKLASGFQASDLPVALSFSSANDVPFADGSSSRFLSADDWLALGPGVKGGAGINLVWYDTKVRAVRAKHTAANRIFPTRTIAQAYAVFDGQPMSLYTKLDVVFTERDASRETMFFGEIICGE